MTLILFYFILFYFLKREDLFCCLGRFHFIKYEVFSHYFFCYAIFEEQDVTE